MAEQEIVKKLFEKVKEEFLSKLQEKGVQLKEEREKEEKLEQYYSSIIDEISSNIIDEWEREKAAEYVMKYAPITVDMRNSMFSDDMRKEFIDAFYKEASMAYKSEKINNYLNKYLDELEKYLDWDLCQKIFYSKLVTLEKGQGRIEKYAKEIFNNITEQSKNDSQIERLKRITKLRVNAFLEYYLDNRLEMYKDIEDEEFYEQMVCISENMENTWKTRITGLLRKGCINKNAVFWEKIEYIESEQEYEIVIKVAEQIFAEFEWDDKMKKQIAEVIQYPRFNKVSLISGDMGTGKTFFVRNFIKYNLIISDVITIPVSVSKILETHTLEKIFLDIFNTIMDMYCSDLTAFFERMRCLEYKICIIVEDVQEVYIRDKEKFQRIIEFIKLYTKYDNINWMFTVNEYEYFIFEIIPQFLNRYCFGDKKDNRNFLKNSFNLREYNAENEIITKILESYNIKFIDDEFMSSILLNRTIETPLYAHILGKCCVGEKVISYPETYFDYIKIVTEIFNKRIGKHDNSIELIEAEKSIINIMRETNRVTYSEADLGKINKNILNELEILHLLSYEEVRDSDIYSFNQYVIQKKYKLRVEVFWALKYIIFCQNTFEEKIQSATELLVFSQNFRDILLPCYLMFIDEKTDDIYEVLDELFVLGAGYYPLFCSRKASIKFEKAVYEYLSCNVLQNNVKMMYALLYYIHYSKLKIREKLTIICLNAQGIVDSGLKDIYETVIREIVSQMINEKNIKKNIIPLILCQVSELNVINGYICGGRYAQILKDTGRTFHNGVKNLEMYIYSKPEIISMISISGGKNTSFMDFFVRGFFESCLREKDLIMLYELLSKERYFDLEPPIGAFFKRNFTCAAGNIYSQESGIGGYAEKYENMINILSRSKRKYDNLTAWFLILNSISKENSGINKQLIPSFVRLWKKDEFREKFKDHKEVKQVFRYNYIELEKYPEIELI